MVVYHEATVEEEGQSEAQGTEENLRNCGIGTGNAMDIATKTQDADAPSKYVLASTPFQVPIIKPDHDKPDPKFGVGLLHWSPRDRFMVSRNDNMPQTLWVWDTRRLALCSVINQISSVKEAQWDPKRSRLAVCTGNRKLYMWSPAGCSIVDIPTTNNFSVRSLRWCPDGNSLLLLDKNKYFPSLY